MFSIIYNLGLFLVLLCSLPKLIWQRLLFQKYRGNLLLRLGFKMPNCSIPDKRKPIIWMHAVSIGETRACSTLASQIKEQYHDAYLFISTTTETGQNEARRCIPYADHYFFLPFDFSWIMKRLVRKIQPDLFILVEMTDHVQMVARSVTDAEPH